MGMRYRIWVIAVAFMLSACGGGSGRSGDGGAGTVNGPNPLLEAAQPISDAVYGETGDGRFVQIPVTDCINVTATPTVVGDWLVYPMHEHKSNCSGPGPYRRSLLGFNLRDGRLYRLYEGASGEAPLLYDTAHGRLW